MAIFDVNFYSEALAHNTAFTVILPQSCPWEDIPTLYLLHGMFGDHTDWLRKSGIERYAEARGLAVVMPDGENGFYADMVHGKKYFTYVADELTAYTRRVFRLSEKREKTYLCGLSMGGYGAFLLGLRRPEQYAACASLSGCLDLAARLSEDPGPIDAVSIWGEGYRDTLPNSVWNLKRLAEHFPKDAPKPRMYAACGLQDGLLENNRGFRDFMADKGFVYRYQEGAGAHNWDFWDSWIVPALDFLLEKT